MNTSFWVIQGLLAAFFTMPGYQKICNSKQRLIANGFIKQGASVVPVRILGILEWLGCVGILVPQYTGIAPMLTPITALCFGLILTGAIFIHTSKKEHKTLPLLIILLALAIIVAYFRFTELV